MCGGKRHDLLGASGAQTGWLLECPEGVEGSAITRLGALHGRREEAGRQRWAGGTVSPRYLQPVREHKVH